MNHRINQLIKVYRAKGDSGLSVADINHYTAWTPVLAQGKGYARLGITALYNAQRNGDYALSGIRGWAAQPESGYSLRKYDEP